MKRISNFWAEIDGREPTAAAELGPWFGVSNFGNLTGEEALADRGANSKFVPVYGK